MHPVDADKRLRCKHAPAEKIVPKVYIYTHSGVVDFSSLSYKVCRSLLRIV